jgi:hypothetical protein
MNLHAILGQIPGDTDRRALAGVLDALTPEQREATYLAAARESMAAYVAYLGLGFLPAAHHLVLIAALQDIERGIGDRLMVCMPPGSAKSTYTSAIFPAWYLGRRPKHSVIAASHTHDLAASFGRRVRNLSIARCLASVSRQTPRRRIAGQPTRVAPISRSVSVARYRVGARTLASSTILSNRARRLTAIARGIRPGSGMSTTLRHASNPARHKS